MLSVQSINDAWWTLSSIFSGGMLGLFLHRIIAADAPEVRMRNGVVFGVAVIAGYRCPGHCTSLGPHLHEYLAIVIGTAVIFLVGFLSIFIIKQK